MASSYVETTLLTCVDTSCDAQLSIRKLGHENSLLRTSLRRRRDSNPNTAAAQDTTPSPASHGAMASALATAMVTAGAAMPGSSPPEITVSDHSSAQAAAAAAALRQASGSAPNLVSLDRQPSFHNMADDSSAADQQSAAAGLKHRSASPAPRAGERSGVGVDGVDGEGGAVDLSAATAGGPHDSDHAKLLYKLGKFAKRWYEQLKDDFSEMRPFEIEEDKPLFELDDFSIKNTTDALNRFDDLFLALVDGPLRDAYNEFLRLTQWTFPVQTLLTLIVLMHSLWSDYLVTLVLVALCVSLLRNYLIAHGYIIEKEKLDVGTRKRPNALRVTNLFSLNLRVMKTFQMLTEWLDKALALWTWKKPEITGVLVAALVGGALLSVVMPVGLLLKLAGTVVLAKLFLLDYVFFRFPRVRAKYDLLYIWYNELPTGKDLEAQRKLNKSLKVSKSSSDLSSVRAASFDPSVLRKLESKLSQLFDLQRVESLVNGWELGKRCTVINKDRTLTGAFKSGRLFLTEKHLLFMRYKTQSPKNISIPLETIVRVEKGKHSGWLPGDAQTLEVITINGNTVTFGALQDRDEVHREVLVHVAQHAYKRKLISRTSS